MNYNFVALIIGLSATVLVGLGCSKKKTTQNVSGEERSQLAWLPPAPSSESEDAKNLRELKEAVEAFGSVKSFRATLVVTNANGTTNGSIKIQKPNRFHGTITADGAKEMEVIGIEKSLYVKIDEKTWIPIQSPEFSKTVTGAFQSSVSGNTALSGNLFPEGTAVSKKAGSGGTCDEYSTSIEQDGASTELIICVSKGLPQYIEATSALGSIRTEYTDYDQVFTIERPTVPKEFR
jgi:hypothetical protein